jgi:hypothetical protein
MNTETNTNTANTINSVVGVFDTHTRAEEAVRELQKSGFDMKKLSIVGKGYHTEEHPIGFYTRGDRIKAWGTTGAFWGGLWGMLVGAAFFWLPGVGPLVVAGPFVHILAGAVEGAALAGGLSALGGALASLGLPREQAIKYESLLKADKYLVIAHGAAAEVGQARDILRRVEAVENEVLAA